MARAIATRCICPPDNWLGRLLMCSFNPTCVKASIAFSCRSLAGIPDKFIPNSTLAMMDKWEIRL